MTSPNQQFAEAVRRSQAAAADVVQTWASITKSAAGAIVPGSVPSGDAGNDPSALIDQAFDFAARMLADQRDLVKRLVQLSGQLAESTGADPASVASAARDRVSSAAESLGGRTQAALGAVRGRADDARQAAIDATDVMLQTARQGADAMFEAAKNQMPLLSAASPDATRAGGDEKPTAAASASKSESKSESKAKSKSKPASGSGKPGRKRGKAVSPEYDTMGKAELQALLVAHGLPKSGNVPELRERLRAHDAG